MLNSVWYIQPDTCAARSFQPVCVHIHSIAELLCNMKRHSGGSALGASVNSYDCCCSCELLKGAIAQLSLFFQPWFPILDLVIYILSTSGFECRKVSAVIWAHFINLGGSPKMINTLNFPTRHWTTPYLLWSSCFGNEVFGNRDTSNREKPIV